MKIKILLSLLLLLFLSKVIGQEKKLEKADNLYKNYAFVDAIKTYESVAEKGYKSVELFQKLGNSYYLNGELEKANNWYKNLFAMNETVDSEYYYRYSQTLKSVGDYDKANEMMNVFNQKDNTDQRAKLYNANKDYLTVIKKNSGRYAIEQLDINSEFSDYGTSIVGNSVVFTSNRETGGISKNVQKWTNQGFTKLYFSTVDKEGKLGNPKEFSSSIASKFNESTPVFSKDGKTIFFTRNNFMNGKIGKDNEKVTRVKIYRAILRDGKWQDIEDLSFNSDNFSTAHPALSFDEKTLYFASDMPGTIGQSDIFKVQINKNGTFGTPENLGNKINTEGKETFPFMSNENELYFASDGHPGLGGLDVFVSKLEDNKFQNAKNIGGPVNGAMDDFAFMIDTQSQIGFFSSNRDGGRGFDDIYKFKEIEKLECEQSLNGIIAESLSGQIIDNAKVSLFDKDMKLVKESFSDSNGNYSFDNLVCGMTYSVRVGKKEYLTKEQRIILNQKSGKTNLSIMLDLEKTRIGEGTDLAKVLDNIIIYFDLDKSIIRSDAAVQLATIAEVMKENPTIKVDVRSFTDSRASKKYNQLLSDQRAQATIIWMINYGISPDRLTGRGYGESHLLNKCSDGIKCIEAEHKLNRRSEFIIVKI